MSNTTINFSNMKPEDIEKIYNENIELKQNIAKS